MSLSEPQAKADRLGRRPFVLAVLAVYATSVLSQGLLTEPVTARASVAPFLLAQIVLTYVWVVLHRRRLRDAGRSTGVVIAIAIVYALQVIVLASIIAVLTSSTRDDAGSGASIFHFWMVIYLMASVTGESNLVGMQHWMTALAAAIFLPSVIAFIFSLWTATRPSVAADP